MKNRLLIFLSTVLLSTYGFSNEISHADWDQLLQKHVSATGLVDYQGFKQDITSLDNYLNALENTAISTLDKDDQLAFWINAYNAYTIKLIVNNLPLKSITALDEGKVWDRKWISLDGKELSLNNIENDIIRPTFKDARIHFAVNCAAKSCPPIYNRAFTGLNINKTLDDLTKKFINGSLNNLSGKSVQVSKIFDWYSSDFGDVREFIQKYSATPLHGEVSFKAYDWSLNSK